VIALVLAGAAVIAVGGRDPAPPSTVVTVPPPPSDEPPAAAPTPMPPAAAAPSPGAAGASDGAAAAATADEGADDGADDGVEAPPRRVVVIATGIAWNDELAAAAAFRLPSSVAFALPADLPAAAERLGRWRAAGRGVAVRFDWRHAATAAAVAVPLAADRGVQAARMAAQWSALETAAAAVVVEPAAAATLAPVARSLAASREAPVLLGADTPAPPPEAWRLDAGRLGEGELEEALARAVAGTPAGETLVLLVEVYPALMDRLVDWLRGLDDAGIALVPLDTLAGDRG